MTKAIVVDATNEIDAITALMAKDISMKLRVANILEGAKVTFLVLSSSTINRGLLLQNDVRQGSLSFVVVPELTGVMLCSHL